MNPLFWIIASTVVVSLISLIGVFTLALREKYLEKILLTLVALASGALMGGAFIHLLPEAIERADSKSVFSWVLVAFVVFFVVEKILQWRHCHEENCEIHTFGHMSLLGDGVHNFIDGLIIAAAFVENFGLGIVVTAVVILHEVPQEIGDFGTLLYAGFKKREALLVNFLSAVMAVAGGIIGYFLANASENFINILIPFAAGGFIYIGASDLLPEIRKTTKLKESVGTLVMFVLGIAIIYLMKFLDVE
ncbi:ZIP family metal transporter [Patescibacteria group bacterium]|nr:ZIP family metal transporter [Patescibacteria group bacterium]